MRIVLQTRNFFGRWLAPLKTLDARVRSKLRDPAVMSLSYFSFYFFIYCLFKLFLESKTGFSTKKNIFHLNSI